MASFLVWIFVIVGLQKIWHVNGKQKPNIIFILGDDIGYDDIGFQSGTIHTPVLDELRAKGQFIPWHYSEPVCSPTRSSLLTGLYPLHNGINTVILLDDAYGLPLNFTLLPQILLDHGYETHMVGKWHLGYYQWAYTPTFRGFQSWLGYYMGAENYFTHSVSGYFDFHDDIGLDCGENCSRVPTELHGTYSTQAFTSRAVEVITNHSIYNRDKPLFLYLPFQTGHYPDACPQQYIDANNATIQDTQRRLYAGMLTCMDEGIGNITSVLRKYGYLDDEQGNTIIIFASDNGAPVPMGNVTKDGSNGGFNWPLRGGKDTIWEGGTRTVALIYGTADVIPAARRAGNYSQLMHVSDWLPTLLSAAGIDVSALHLNYTFDGVDHWQGIIGNYSSADHDSDLYFAFRDTMYYGYDVSPMFANIAFRNKWFKVLNGSGGSPHGWFKPPEMDDDGDDGANVLGVMSEVDDAMYPLYDLEIDPSEKTDISANHQAVVDQLLDEMVALKQTGVPQSTDQSGCPNRTAPVYPVVGKVLWPWCG